MQHEMDAFLRELFGGSSPAWFYLWTLHNKRSHWFTEASLDDYFAEAATGVIGDEDVYVGVALASSEGVTTERIKASNVAGLIGFWADVDYKWEGAKKSNLPRDASQALDIIRDVPLQPTLIVSTGHGFHCWWLFEEPWLFDTDDERAHGALMAKRWQGAIRNVASRHGCGVDSTFDLARVLRVPGTFNCKDRENPQPVVVREQRGERFNPSDFEPYLADDTLAERDDVEVRIGELDPNMAEPPGFFEKFMALVENDSTFQQYYLHKRRPPAGDDSLSVYDLCLANIAVRVGWTDEEVLCLLIKHRKKYGELPKHRGYYELTIKKAKTQYHFQAQADPTVTAADGATESPEVDQKGILEAVSDTLKIPVRGLIEYTGSPPKYRLLLADAEINLGGVSSLTNQTAFRNKLVEAAGVFPMQQKNADWTMTVNMLLRVREQRSQGDDMHEAGKVQDWIESYLRHRTPESRGVDQAVRSKSSFVHENALWIFARSFQAFLRDVLGERLDANDIAAILTHIGARDEPLYYVNHTTNKRTSTRARRLPPERFPVAEYVGGDYDDYAIHNSTELADA